MLQTVDTSTASRAETGESMGHDCFEATMIRGFSGARRYHVFCFKPGLLLLDVGSVISASEKTGIIVGGILGGAVGSMVGSSIGKNLHVEPNWERHLKAASIDEILEVARQRKNSLVLKVDEIDSVIVEASRWYESLFQSRKTVGSVTVRDRTYGKLKLQLHDVMSMNSAMDTLPKFIADRVQLNAVFDITSCAYRSC